MYKVSFDVLGMKVNDNLELYYDGTTYNLEYDNITVLIAPTFVYVYEFIIKNNLLLEELT